MKKHRFIHEKVRWKVYFVLEDIYYLTLIGLANLGCKWAAEKFLKDNYI